MVKQKNNGNGFGIASFVLGILGVILFFPVFAFGYYPRNALIYLLLPIIVGITAIILASVQRKKYSNGFATAGFILGIISTAISCLLFIALAIGNTRP